MPRIQSSAFAQRSTGKAAAIAAGVLAIAAPAAGAQSGTFNSDEGGTVYVEQPRVTKVTCIRKCASHKRARPGSTLAVRGKALGGAQAVTFLGTTGKDDDIHAKVRAGSATRLNVKVPHGAVSGPVAVQISKTIRSRASKPVAILPPLPPEPNPTLTPVPGPAAAGAPRLETGTSRTKAFFGARRTVVFQYRISGAAPSTVTVEVVRAGDGAVVQTWNAGAVPVGSVQTIVWDGREGGAAAKPGRYSFRLSATGGTGAVARSSQTTAGRDSFDLYNWYFPIRGAHSYGGSGGQFGAGRGGRSHQGQDVFAKCGTPLVAARGGKVKFRQYQSLAGNYIVVDADRTGTDYAYMHLAEPSAFRPGDRVYTGQRLGSVGDTGRADGCHLHMELWGAPGWYSGGKPFDPLPSLKAWDAYS